MADAATPDDSNGELLDASAGEPVGEADREAVSDADLENVIDAQQAADAAARAAERKASSIAAGRRIGGSAGAAMAGAMLAVGEIYDGPAKDDTVVAVSESPDEPGDIDTDGIEFDVGTATVRSQPPGT